MTDAARPIATGIVRLAARLMPSHLRAWGEAMYAELDEIDGRAAALSFAFGCLGVAIRQSVETHILHPLGLPLSDARRSIDREGNDMDNRGTLFGRPARLAGACAAGAVALGLSYLLAAGAPATFIAINIGALLIGFVLVMIARLVEPSGGVAGGAFILVAGIALLATSLLGTPVEGASRWIAVGPLFLQPSLMLLPLMAIGFARRQDPLSTAGIVAAAAAMALQPDRAMAGALVAGLATLAIIRRDRLVLFALGAAAIGLAVTLLRADTLPAVPYVDRILYTSFAVSPLAGLAVLAGVTLMMVPAIAGALIDREHREAYAVFGAVWLAVIAAAALSNYPTPVVGYGGSAIVGYVVSLLGLPKRANAASNESKSSPNPAQPERRELSYSA